MKSLRDVSGHIYSGRSREPETNSTLVLYSAQYAWFTRSGCNRLHCL